MVKVARGPGAGIGNVSVVDADGSKAASAHALFDAIVLSGSVADVPAALPPPDQQKQEPEQSEEHEERHAEQRADDRLENAAGELFLDGVEAGRVDHHPGVPHRHEQEARRAGAAGSVDLKRDKRAREQPKTGKAEQKADHGAFIIASAR